MARQIWLTRDEAELLVDLLEFNYRTDLFSHSGMGADLASQIRALFGMGEQPELKFKEIAIKDIEDYFRKEKKSKTVKEIEDYLSKLKLKDGRNWP